MNIRIFQHIEFENPGLILGWIRENGHTSGYTRFFANENLNGVSQPDLLIIMGGPMGVNDETEFPWLKAEKEFISEAIRANTDILGICLGAQLLASCLGAGVYRNTEKEIGYYPVFKTPAASADPVFNTIPSPWTVFHWHGDTFDLPEGAILMAQSEACRHQAFRKGRFTGIQFHPEADNNLVQEIVRNCAGDLVSSRFIQTGGQILETASAQGNLKEILFTMMDRIIKL